MRAAEYRAFESLANLIERQEKELRLLRAIRDEYSQLLSELPSDFDTPALDAYDKGDK